MPFIQCWVRVSASSVWDGEGGEREGGRERTVNIILFCDCMPACVYMTVIHNLLMEM